MKPRTISGLIVLAIILLCVGLISTRAYFKYVQPPSSEPETKKVSYIPIEKVQVYGTGYFGPKREDYKKEDEYLRAVSLNGQGEKTRSGTKPQIGTISADIRFYPFGTIVYIPEIDFWGTVEDTGSRIKGKKRIDIFCGHGKKAERIANTWGPGTPITLITFKRS